MSKRKYYWAGFINNEKDDRYDGLPCLFTHKWKAEIFYDDVRKVEIKEVPRKEK